MCDALLATPILGGFTTVGTALSAVGFGLSALSSIQQGQAAASASEYNARVAQQNAELARRKAVADEQLARQRAIRILGQGRADVAKSGITLSGSALDVLSDSAANSELDALSIRYGGVIRQADATAQAALDRYQGNQRQTAAYLGAGTNLLLDARGLGLRSLPSDPGPISVASSPALPAIFSQSSGIRLRTAS
ncbi:MAG: hypothetical protein WCF16_12610 [Alphaproteobacteria bacterium]